MTDDTLAARYDAGVREISALTTELEGLNSKLVIMTEHMITVSVLSGKREDLAAWRTAREALHQMQEHLTAIRSALARRDTAEALRQVALARDSHQRATAHVREARGADDEDSA